MNKKLTALALGALLLAGAGVAKAQTDNWIHIRVQDGDDQKVSVNLPMSLVEVALQIAEKEAFEGDHNIRFGRHHDVDIDDLRTMWAELRDAGDAEYVTAEDGDEMVKIYRQGDKVYINVDENGQQKVRMQVPFSVVDTLLDSDGDNLNLIGAVREMARVNNGEVIQVNDGDTAVRIWIDAANQD